MGDRESYKECGRIGEDVIFNFWRWRWGYLEERKTNFFFSFRVSYFIIASLLAHLYLA